MADNLKIAFWGTPEICIPILESLKKSGTLPVVVITQEDAPRGRGQILTPPPVKVWATENNIRVLQPKKLDKEFVAKLKQLNLDVSLVVAYGNILNEEAINTPRHGTMNVHYSLLPKYRGATPVEAVLLSGETHTGVSIQKMRKELDAGAVIFDKQVEIGPKETKPELLKRLSTIAGEIIPNVLKDYVSGVLTSREQDHTLASFAPKIEKSHGEIRLNDNGETNWRKFRAYTGNPGTFTFVEKNGKHIRLKITEADFIDGEFVVKKVIPEGKKETDFGLWLKS